MPDSIKTAVILTNLGTPDKPEAGAVKRYLREFLSDSRVVEGKGLRRLAWLTVLNVIILNLRPRKVAKLYSAIWKEDSPMRKILNDQVTELQLKLQQTYEKAPCVFAAMTYGSPGLQDRLVSLASHGYQRILIIPMYPQYSATTTAPVYDQVARFQLGRREVLDIRIVKYFYDHPAYIHSLAKRISTFRQEGATSTLLLSYHGLPKEYADKGDPYPLQCHKTSALVAQALGLTETEWVTTFQSRFGPAKWLQPYTDKTLERLAQQQTKAIDVVCPAFTADCLETLEEIAQENKEVFHNAGGETYRYIPAVNSTPTFIEALAVLVQEQAADWLTLDNRIDEESNAA